MCLKQCCVAGPMPLARCQPVELIDRFPTMCFLGHWTNGQTGMKGLLFMTIYGLVQEKRNSIANALELRLSCTNPSI